MYIQKTKYYCRKCRTHDHWGDEPCQKGNHVQPSNRGFSQEQSQEGDEVPEREGSNKGDPDVLSGQASEKDLESGGDSDARKTELRGKTVHKEVQRKPTKNDPVEIAQEFIKRLPGRPRIYPDPVKRKKERHTEYMKAYRARKS